MKVEIRNQKVVIDGYVNAVDRYSKPLSTIAGKFIEKIMPGCFRRALEANPDVEVLLNHDSSRVLASTSQGNAKLYEDNIGLRAIIEIDDQEVMEKAKQGKLKGWSFGFKDKDVETLKNDDGLYVRNVIDIDLREISIIDDRKTPAYYGTSIEMRDDEEVMINYRSDEFNEKDLFVEGEKLTNESFKKRLEKLKEK